MTIEERLQVELRNRIRVKDKRIEELEAERDQLTVDWIELDHAMTESEATLEELRNGIDISDIQRESAERRTVTLQAYLDDLLDGIAAAEAKLEAVRELDPASAIVALVTTYYADHTDESWAALHDLAAEIRALLDGKKEAFDAPQD